MRAEAVDLEPVAETEGERPVAIGGAQVSEEARDDPRIVERRDRLEERPRAALPEEAAGVQHDEALARRVLQSVEVVEVAAVRHDVDGRPGPRERGALACDERRDRGDRVGLPEHEPRDALLDGALRPDRPPLVATMRVREPGVAQVGDEADAGATAEHGADDVGRRGRRRRENAVDLALADHAHTDANRVGHPRDLGIGQQQPAAGEARVQRETGA